VAVAGDAVAAGAGNLGDEPLAAEFDDEPGDAFASSSGVVMVQGQVRVELVLGPDAARAQQVEADAGDHGREPPAQVLDLVGVAAVEPQPGLWTASSASLSEPSSL
jgi:hypothetical protein